VEVFFGGRKVKEERWRIEGGGRKLWRKEGGGRKVKEER
jgi:hypothetical protein